MPHKPNLQGRCWVGKKKRQSKKKNPIKELICATSKRRLVWWGKLKVLFHSWFVIQKSLWICSKTFPAHWPNLLSCLQPSQHHRSWAEHLPGGDEPRCFFIPDNRANRPSKKTETRIVWFFNAVWRVGLFSRYSIFSGQTDFLNTKAECNVCTGIFLTLLFFSSPPPPLWGSCWAIDFLWLAQRVLIIAHFLPGISWKQLSDKCAFRQCYLSRSSLPAPALSSSPIPDDFSAAKKSTAPANLRPSSQRFCFPTASGLFNLT